MEHDEESYVAGYAAALRDLNGSETMARARIITDDVEHAARASMRNERWLDEHMALRVDRCPRRTLPVHEPIPGRVYVLHDATRGLVKIGYTAGSGEARRNAIAHASGLPELALIAEVDGTLADERALHERFAASRIHGEWFLIEGEVNEWLREVTA